MAPVIPGRVASQASAIALLQGHMRPQGWEVLLQDGVFVARSGRVIVLADASYEVRYIILRFLLRNADHAFIVASMRGAAGGYDDERYAEYVRWCSPHIGETAAEWIERTPLVRWLRANSGPDLD